MVHDFKKFPELTNTQMNLYYFESPHKQILESFKGYVVDVHDGDTIKIGTTFRDFNTTVRLGNIAAPELNERGGEESRDWLADKVLGKDVDIIINPDNRVGKWGRIIGEVFVGGFNINEESLINGQSIPWSERGNSPFVDFASTLDSFRSAA